ncbi:MAG: prolipoprotein diacylglyceryl transferase [Phycisphaerales bacterium]|nr:prolipoprotein diacylglyceryl transferase [Phycisphaerales bacterium]
MTDGAHFHTLSPVALDVGLQIRWYGLSYVTGFVCAYFILRALARRRVIAIPPARVADVMVYIIFGVLIGGRLGYALLGYDPSLLWTFSPSFPYWNMLAIQKGGMASHGGMIGVIIATWLVSRGFKRPDGTVEGRADWKHIADTLALCTPIGFFFGRIANFINGELLGKIIAPAGEPGPWYSVRFPQELLGWNRDGTRSGHTPPLSAEQFNRLDGLVQSVRRPGESWNAALEHVVAKAGQFRAQLEPLVSARHPSQLYAALLEGLAVLAVVWIVAARPRKPGVVGGWWLLSYGVARIIDEYWRLPDAQFAEGRPLGLSRGQWFSTAMVAAGVVAVIVCSRKAAPKMMGWLHPTPVEPAGA